MLGVEAVGVDELSEGGGGDADGDGGGDAVGEEVGAAAGDDADEGAGGIHDGAAAVPFLEGDGRVEVPEGGGGAEAAGAIMWAVLLVLLFATSISVSYEQAPPISQPCVSVTQFGATGDDNSDDTQAIQTALNHCLENGGGVCVPAGTFTISLPPFPNQTDLCLAIPSDCTLSGVGEDSILKYSDNVNVQGWWRMLGPALQADLSSRQLSQ